MAMNRYIFTAFFSWLYFRLRSLVFARCQSLLPISVPSTLCSETNLLGSILIFFESRVSLAKYPDPYFTYQIPMWSLKTKQISSGNGLEELHLTARDVDLYQRIEMPKWFLASKPQKALRCLDWTTFRQSEMWRTRVSPIVPTQIAFV